MADGIDQPDVDKIADMIRNMAMSFRQQTCVFHTEHTKSLKFHTGWPIKNVPQIHAAFQCIRGNCSGFVWRKGVVLA